MKAILFLMSLAIVANTQAQTASKYLDVNQVKALIFNSSDMHWDLFGNGNAAYEVPIGGGVSSDFAAGLWVGGYDNAGQLYVAAQTYRQDGVDFWPGPLDTTDASITTTISNQYDKMWKINQSDITAFTTNFANGNVQNSTFTPIPEILSWPAHGTGNNSKQLAPFVDVNHNGIYDPLVGGDYPEMKGDQMIYYIFNDNLGPHQASGGNRMGLEIHATAYAYGNSATTSTYHFLDYATFYNYKIINRSNRDYNNVYITLFSDVDLGYYGDDYIGCDVQNNFGYGYNGDSYDDGGYGSNPPAAGYQILNGPFSNSFDGIDNNHNGIVDEDCEQNLMNKFNYYNNSFAGVPLQTTDPQNATQTYQYMTGEWRDGLPFTCGGNGYGGAINADFMYPGSSYTASPCGSTPWTEGTAGNVPGDRRYMMGSGPFTFEAGSTETIEYVHCTSFDNVDALAKLKSDMGLIKTFYNVFTPPAVCNTVGIKEQQHNINLDMYPNPTSKNVTLAFKETQSDVSTEITDVMGNHVFINKEKNITKMTLNLMELPSGFYFIKIITGNQYTIKKIIKE